MWCTPLASCRSRRRVAGTGEQVLVMFVHFKFTIHPVRMSIESIGERQALENRCLSETGWFAVEYVLQAVLALLQDEHSISALRRFWICVNAPMRHQLAGVLCAAPQQRISELTLESSS